MWCGCSERWMAARLDRRQALMTLAALAAAGCATIKPEHHEAALRLAEESTSVDLHSHPGMLPASPLSTEGQLQRMSTGKVRASLFAAVADGPLIGRRPTGALYASREPRPGELYAYTYRSLDKIRAHATAGRVLLIESTADLEAPRAQGKPGAILAVEGGDFLEGRAERVQEAYERGVRSIQLTHYRINELGDIQTEDATHGGLTPFGRDVIRELNRLGMLIDLAHATLADVRAAVETSTVPMILSHTNLQNASGWARFISPEHARLLGEHGGVVGAMPIALGAPGFGGFIDNIGRLVDTVGVDHVAIGTDMDGIIPARLATFDDYAEWASIATALRARGFGRDEVARVLGGNFARVFRVATGRAGA
jgi:membrane dipeptidase